MFTCRGQYTRSMDNIEKAVEEAREGNPSETGLALPLHLPDEGFHSP